MHSAASNLSFWIQIVMENATPAQICAAKKIDYAVSYARTVAGVHYKQDNIAGLNLGQEVLARHLCKHLAKKFKGDYDYCMWKVQKKRFDWRHETPQMFAECAMADTIVGAPGAGSSIGDLVDGVALGDFVSSVTAGTAPYAFDDQRFCAAM